MTVLPTAVAGSHAWVTGLPGTTACGKCGAPYAGASHTNTCSEWYGVLAARTRAGFLARVTPKEPE